MEDYRRVSITEIGRGYFKVDNIKPELNIINLRRTLGGDFYIVPRHEKGWLSQVVINGEIYFQKDLYNKAPILYNKELFNINLYAEFLEKESFVNQDVVSMTHVCKTIFTMGQQNKLMQICYTLHKTYEEEFPYTEVAEVRKIQNGW